MRVPPLTDGLSIAPGREREPHQVLAEPLSPALPQFVGRDREIGFVTKALDAYQYDSIPEQNVLHVYGPSGMGKTTLLTRIDQIASERGYPSIYIQMSDFPADPTQVEQVGILENIIAVLRQEDTRLGRQLNTEDFDQGVTAYKSFFTNQTPPASYLFDKTLETIKNEFERIFTSHQLPILILVDYTDRSGTGLNNFFEEKSGKSMLGQFAKENKIFMVMAEEQDPGHTYWITRKWFDSEITPFTEDEISLQLAINQETAREVRALTGGHPGANAVIKDVMDTADLSLTVDNLATSKAIIVKALGEYIRTEFIIKQQPIFQELFDLASILRVFNFDILGKFNKDIGKFKMHILGPYVERGLVRLSNEKRGYVMDETVRNMWLNYLKQERREWLTETAKKAMEAYRTNCPIETPHLYDEEIGYQQGLLLELENSPAE